MVLRSYHMYATKPTPPAAATPPAVATAADSRRRRRGASGAAGVQEEGDHEEHEPKIGYTYRFVRVILAQGPC